MHNLISYNQLAEWRNFEKALDRCNEQTDLVNDYFNCLIECDDNQQNCRRICKHILN